MRAFLITPFTAERAREAPAVFAEVQRAIELAVTRAGLDLIHPARINRAGAIMQGQIEPELEQADVVLALLTGQNPNVFFELGFARRDAILICRSRDDVPFDIGHRHYWSYGGPGELDSLAARLEEGIRQTLAGQQRPARALPQRPPATRVAPLVAFAGATERGTTRPVLVTSMAEFRATFGTPLDPGLSYLPAALSGFFANGGTRAYVTRVLSAAATVARVQLSAGASSSPSECLIIEATSPGAWGNQISVQVRAGARIGWRLTIVCGTDDGAAHEEDYDNCSLDPDGPNPLVERVNSRSQSVRLTWFGTGRERAGLPLGRTQLAGGSDGSALTAAEFTGKECFETGQAAGLAAVAELDDVDLVCIPDHVHPRLSVEDRLAVTDALVRLCEQRRDCIAILATPAGEHEPQQLKPRYDTPFAAMYYPWIQASEGLVPPIGHVAGAFARNDGQRGLHCAPVGVALDGGLVPPAREEKASADHRDALERLGLNTIAVDAIWGQPALMTAYTLAIDERFRYVNATRLAAFIRKLVVRGLSWLGFERSTPAAWQRIEREVGAFLMQLWEDGALFGSRPEEAFFIRCDHTTMTEDDIANGRVIVLLGIAFDPMQGPAAIELPLMSARPG